MEIEKVNYNSMQEKKLDDRSEYVDPHLLKYERIDSRKKFFFCILSHKKSTKRKKQMEGLLSENNENVIFYYFLGDPNQKEKYIVDEANKTVTLKVPDNYESLPMKTYLSIEYVIENHLDSIEGIFKTDDDIDINLNLLYNNLCDSSELDYFGNQVNVVTPYMSSWHFGKCEDPIIGTTPHLVQTSNYCSGGGYYINKRNLERIQKSREIFENGIFEDVCTGLALNSEGIFPDRSIWINQLGCRWDQ